jgi:heme exporter protein D
MNWESAADFFAMGGYAAYVWGSFGLAAVALAFESVLVRHRRAAVVRNLRRRVLAGEISQEAA